MWKRSRTASTWKLRTSLPFSIAWQILCSSKVHVYFADKPAVQLTNHGCIPALRIWAPQCHWTIEGCPNPSVEWQREHLDRIFGPSLPGDARCAKIVRTEPLKNEVVRSYETLLATRQHGNTVFTKEKKKLQGLPPGWVLKKFNFKIMLAAILKKNSFSFLDDLVLEFYIPTGLRRCSY